MPSRMFTRVAGACALALLLGACTAQQAGYLETKTKQIQATHDTTAKGLIAAVCAMSVGAYHRLGSPLAKRGVDSLCGGDGSTPVTIEGLAAFLEAQQYLASP